MALSLLAAAAVAARLAVGPVSLWPGELRLERPVIRWIAITGGAVKFDLGGSRPARR